MSIVVPGLHHVTAISGAPQANLDFYSGVLNQRLVKKTVNFDDPATYHLYYGDTAGTPGTIMTFFPFADAGPGRAGPGMASAVAYTVPDLDARMEALALDAAAFDGPWERFGQRGIALKDSDGLRIELIEDASAEAGFHSVTLWLDDPEPTARVLEIMGYARAGEEDAATMGSNGRERRVRLVSSAPERGAVVDLVTSDASSIGRPGAGTVHHVAFRARDASEQEAWRETLTEAGLAVTPVIDRQYFDAIYFRTPGGVLFEIATDPPGFAVDEDPDHLGEALKLPPRYEAMRARIEQILQPLRARVGAA